MNQDPKQNGSESGQGNQGFGEYRQYEPQNGEPKEEPIYMPPIQDFSPFQRNLHRNDGATSQTLGIVGLITSLICCCFPAVGLILGILSVIYAAKDEKYNGGSHASNVGKVCGIIAIVICALIIISDIVMKATGFTENLVNQLLRELEAQQPPIQ